MQIYTKNITFIGYFQYNYYSTVIMIVILLVDEDNNKLSSRPCVS